MKCIAFLFFTLEQRTTSPELQWFSSCYTSKPSEKRHENPMEKQGKNSRIKWEFSPTVFKTTQSFFTKCFLAIWYPSLNKNKPKKLRHDSKPSEEASAFPPCLGLLCGSRTGGQPGRGPRKGPEAVCKVIQVSSLHSQDYCL